MNDEDEKLIQNVAVWGAVLVGGYWFVVKPLLSKIGVDPEDVATVTNQKNLLPAQNPFNPAFQPATDLFNANPSYDQNDNLLTEQQYYQAIKSLYDSNDPSLTADVKTIASIAETLNNSMGDLFSFDKSAILGALNQIVTQTQMADVSAYYFYNFGSDMLSDLGGARYFLTGLKDDQLAQIINHINSLPAN